MRLPIVMYINMYPSITFTIFYVMCLRLKKEKRNLVCD
jgi:hypothetical protein